MEGQKSAVGSTTIWGGLIAAVPAIIDGVFSLGVKLTAPDSIQAVNDIAASGLLPPHVAGVCAAVGGFLAIIGRVLARERVTKVL